MTDSMEDVQRMRDELSAVQEQLMDASESERKELKVRVKELKRFVRCLVCFAILTAVWQSAQGCSHEYQR